MSVGNKPNRMAYYDFDSVESGPITRSNGVATNEVKPSDFNSEDRTIDIYMADKSPTTMDLVLYLINRFLYKHQM
jgi:hypothetical protein